MLPLPFKTKASNTETYHKNIKSLNQVYIIKLKVSFMKLLLLRIRNKNRNDFLEMKNGEKTLADLIDYFPNRILQPT